MPTSISITWNTLVLSILIIVLNYYQTKLFVLFCAARQNHYKIYPSQELIAIGNISEINEISYFKKIQVFHSFHNEMSIVKVIPANLYKYLQYNGTGMHKWSLFFS